jgi:hypothetical protein
LNPKHRDQAWAKREGQRPRNCCVPGQRHLGGRCWPGSGPKYLSEPFLSFAGWPWPWGRHMRRSSSGRRCLWLARSPLSNARHLCVSLASMASPLSEKLTERSLDCHNSTSSLALSHVHARHGARERFSVKRQRAVPTERYPTYIDAGLDMQLEPGAGCHQVVWASSTTNWVLFASSFAMFSSCHYSLRASSRLFAVNIANATRRLAREHPSPGHMPTNHGDH